MNIKSGSYLWTTLLLSFFITCKFSEQKRLEWLETRGDPSVKSTKTSQRRGQQESLKGFSRDKSSGNDLEWVE